MLRPCEREGKDFFRARSMKGLSAGPEGGTGRDYVVDEDRRGWHDAANVDARSGREAVSPGLADLPRSVRPFEALRERESEASAERATYLRRGIEAAEAKSPGIGGNGDHDAVGRGERGHCLRRNRGQRQALSELEGPHKLPRHAFIGGRGPGVVDSRDGEETGGRSRDLRTTAVADRL